MSYVVSNSVFFAVPDAPPLENVGWEIRVKSHSDYSTVLATIPEWVSLSVGPQLNDPGSGSVTLDLNSAFWTTILTSGAPATELLDYEHLWEAYEDGALRFQWLGETVEERMLDDTETYGVTVSGPGAAQVLRWAKIMRPAFPLAIPAGLDPATSVGNSNTKVALGWEFPTTWSAMKMWYTMFTAAISRGTIGFVHPMFTDKTDSAGAPWEYVPTVATVSGHGFRPTPGQDLLDFLNDCTGQDPGQWFAMRAEWFMWPGFRLDVRKKIGTHREDTVIYFDGQIQQKTRTRVRADIANIVCVLDVYGEEAIAVDQASVGRWGRREKLENNTTNVTERSRHNALANTFIEMVKDEISEWVITVPYYDVGKRPFVDYNIGDWIGVATSSAAGVSRVDAYRVMAIVVQVTADGTTLELTLESIIQDRLKHLEQQVTTISNSGPQDVRDAIGLTPDPDTSLTWDQLKEKLGVGDQGLAVFIQDQDPGANAKAGDFWYQTNYNADTEVDYRNDDADTEQTQPNDQADRYDPREHIPGNSSYFKYHKAAS